MTKNTVFNSGLSVCSSLRLPPTLSKYRHRRDWVRLKCKRAQVVLAMTKRHLPRKVFRKSKFLISSLSLNDKKNQSHDQKYASNSRHSMYC